MDNQNGNKDNNKNNKQGFSFVILITMLTALLVFAMYQFQGVDSDQEITYNKFLKMIDEKKVEKVEIKSDRILITAKKESGDKVNKEYYTGRMNDDQLVEKLEKAKIDFNQEVPDTTSAIVAQYAMNIIPLVIFIALIVWMTRKMSKGGGMMGIGKSNAKMYVEKQTGVTFKDVAGQDEAKESLQEVVDFLHNPGKYTSVGAKLPKGALLVGPPGTGKTLLAKAVAGEAKVPFFSLSGSAFVEMYVGVGASRVRDLFKQAQQMAPCIIFIDEIDAIGKSRDTQMGGNDEREQTLNQLLVEMDGMEENTGVVVIAATNRPDVLDPALLRAGRFDRQITVSLPDRKGREAILKVHARNKQFAADIDLGALAKRTPGFSGADLENVLNESAIMAVRHNETEITMADIDEAIDRVMMGPAKVSKTYDDKTKKLVAYHESGHAIVGLFMENAQVVQKVTIIPRGQAGGYNLMTPKEEKMMNTKNDLLATITSFMGGRVAEELFFDDVTTGASNDIERATNIAKDMVTLYGMSDLGPIKYNSGSENVFLGRDYNQPNNVSGQVAFEIDQEVRKIVNGCHDEAKKLIQAHETELTRIAEALMEYETLTAEQIQKVVKGEDVSADFTDAKVEQSSTDEMNA